MLPPLFRTLCAMSLLLPVLAIAAPPAAPSAVLVAASLAAAAPSSASALATVPVRTSGAASAYSADGVVEAVRQSVVASQVAGAITSLPVKVGDAVQKGQLLARIDARAAQQEADASRAQVEMARATLQAAGRDFARQKQLFAQHYISQANLDQAESRFKEASAQANALLAQAGALQTRSGFYELTAPYAGLLAEVPAMPGEMAMPGRALMTLYDPAAMRVRVTLPQSRAALLVAGQPVWIEVAGLPRALQASKVTLLPAADAATHTVQLWLDLPPGAGGNALLRPGMFARASLPQSAGVDAAHLFVPASAVLRRAELSVLYVLGAQGKPLLRQVRPGALLGAEREILAGVSAGEQVVLDPLAAARQSGSTTSGDRHE